MSLEVSGFGFGICGSGFNDQPRTIEKNPNPEALKPEPYIDKLLLPLADPYLIPKNH